MLLLIKFNLLKANDIYNLNTSNVTVNLYFLKPNTKPTTI